MKITKRVIALALMATALFLLSAYITRPAEPPRPEPTTKINMTERTDRPCRCGEREEGNDHE